jgi:hypothetical protein
MESILHLELFSLVHVGRLQGQRFRFRGTGQGYLSIVSFDSLILECALWQPSPLDTSGSL